MRAMVLVLALGGIAAAQQVTDKDLELAIESGTAQKLIGVVEVGSSRPGELGVQMAGVLGRVSSAAADAATIQEPFTRARVTDQMLEPTVRVTVYPNVPGPNFRVAPTPESVVIQPRGSRAAATAVHPVRTGAYPIAWSTGAGGRLESQALVADFERAALPAGEIEIVVRTSRGEQRYRVPPADLDQVR